MGHRAGGASPGDARDAEAAQKVEVEPGVHVRPGVRSTAIRS
ncbi:hypothetical protein [Microbispora catharanthi]|nr:hypothetical protein [Microbispora catharanthi]